MSLVSVSAALNVASQKVTELVSAELSVADRELPFLTQGAPRAIKISDFGKCPWLSVEATPVTLAARRGALPTKRLGLPGPLQGRV